MDIVEYRKDFLEKLRSDAALNSSDPNEEFIQKAIEILEEANELSDPLIHYFGKKGRRGKMMQINAFDFDEADGSVCLVISDFYNTDTTTTLTNTQIELLYSRMKTFLTEVCEGDITNFCDDSDPIINIAHRIKKLMGKNTLESQVLKFKFYIITNSLLSGRVKSLKQEDLYGKPVELNIWYLERFYDLYNSENSEEIEIETSEFGVPGLQCIKANMSDCQEYDAYLAIVPGKFLADIYLKHGSRLLQGNVRAFLSLKNNVNKGIRKTIVTEPKKFFTYNNGIATIAQSIEIKEDKIISMKGLQIINGGQTTASMASAVIKKDNETLDNIFVPMKLTVLKSPDQDEQLKEKNYNEMIRKISECANSQTKVTPADFFSNHKFHIFMENLSQSARNYAPPANGYPHPTIWFYERSRGKWEQEQMKMKPSERDKFIKKHPKKQVVKKEQLAKCLNIIDGAPHIACGNATQNMNYIAAEIDRLCETSEESINDYYFRKTIVSVIIFSEIEKLVARQDWYPKGGNRAQIVPYSIAKLISSIPAGKTIDYDLIWKNQCLYPSMVREFERITYIAHKYILDSGIIAREFARKSDTWKNFRDKISYTLSEEFIADLRVLKEQKEEEKSARKERRFLSEIDNSVEIFKLGYDYWISVFRKMEEEKVLSYGDRMYVESIANIIKKQQLPTASQAKRLIKVYNKAEDEGVIFE